jgi:hypothetical protein
MKGSDFRMPFHSHEEEEKEEEGDWGREKRKN